jgi:hypothetical protein
VVRSLDEQLRSFRIRPSQTAESGKQPRHHCAECFVSHEAATLAAKSRPRLIVGPQALHLPILQVLPRHQRSRGTGHRLRSSTAAFQDARSHNDRRISPSSPSRATQPGQDSEAQREEERRDKFPEKAEGACRVTTEQPELTASKGTPAMGWPRPAAGSYVSGEAAAALRGSHCLSGQVVGGMGEMWPL